MDVEKTIEFILEQQARFSTDLSQFSNSLNQLSTGLNQVSDGLNRLNGIVLDLANSQERTNPILETLAERHVELAVSHKESTDQLKIIEQNLNSLILALERHIASHS